MKHTPFARVAAVTAVCMLSFGGAILAQESPASQPAPSPGGSSAEPGKPAKPPETLVGKTVVNIHGETIGQIRKVLGDQLIVALPGAEDYPVREIALPWDKLLMTGSGDAIRLQTNLTKEELKALLTQRSG